MAVRNSTGPGLQRVWRGILDRVAERVGERDLEELIRPLEPVALTPAELRLQAPTRLVMLCVNDSFLPALRQAVADVIGPRQVLLEVAVREQGELFPDTLPRRVDRQALAMRALLHRELRRRGLQPVRAPRQPRRREPARPPLPPALHLRRTGARKDTPRERHRARRPRTPARGPGRLPANPDFR